MSEQVPLRVDDLKRIKEVMIPLDEFPWVTKQDTLAHAMATIEGARLEVGARMSLPRVLLVLDREGDLAGLIRRRDIMRGLEPDFLVNQPKHRSVRFFKMGADPLLWEMASEASLERIVNGLRERSDRLVESVMRPVPTTLRPDDPFITAVYEMVTLNESAIPVEENGRVLGVVRSADVFHELAQLLH
jgi:CBS domain-containing protein